MHTKKTAISAIQKQIEEIDKLRRKDRRSATFTKWQTNTLLLLKDIFGENSLFYLAFGTLSFQVRGTFMVTSFNLDEQMEIRNQQGYLNDLETASGLLQSGIEQIRLKGIEGVYDGKNTSNESSEIMKIITLVEKKLRKAIHKLPSDEKDVQDALASIFIGADLDQSFTREKERIANSSKGYIPDFVFSKIKTVVEVKLCNSKERISGIIEEIHDDTIAYKSKYDNIIFVVYDTSGAIRDVDEFTSGLEVGADVMVRVVKH